MRATLILENGIVFQGESMGDTADRMFELVFNTSMTGYQEILTDPSYAGQGVVMTYPLIGNYGVNSMDNESTRAWAEAFVVRHLAERGSNFRREGDLNDYLKKYHITGIQGVDTRALTRLLRSQGTMNGMITCAENFCMEEALAKLKAYRVEKAVEAVTCKEPQTLAAWEERDCLETELNLEVRNTLARCNRERGGKTVRLTRPENPCRVAVLDLGVRNSMLACLEERCCEVTILPAATSAKTILSGCFDGVVLSDGPGDPADNGAIVAEVKKLYESDLPLFGCGLGHQLLALAAGGRTEKLPYGHRGSSHPVRETATGKLTITCQNHGYAVKADSLSADVATASWTNVHDGTVEGLDYVRPNCFGVQFTVGEATGRLFDRFVDMMKGGTR